MQEIGLQELIVQVRKELLAASSTDPIFFIDKVELELAVKVVKQAQGGVKVTVIGVVEGNIGASAGGEQGHVVKVSLSPLLSVEEIRKEVLSDSKKRNIAVALLKGDDTAGPI